MIKLKNGKIENWKKIRKLERHEKILRNETEKLERERKWGKRRKLENWREMGKLERNRKT